MGLRSSSSVDFAAPRCVATVACLLAIGCSQTRAEQTTWTNGGATVRLTAPSGAVVFDVFQEGVQDGDDPSDDRSVVVQQNSVGAQDAYAYDYTYFSFDVGADVADCHQGDENISLTLWTDDPDRSDLTVSLGDVAGTPILVAALEPPDSIGGDGSFTGTVDVSDPCFAETGAHGLEVDWSFADQETVELKSTFAF